MIGQSWSADQDWAIVIDKFWLENCDMAIGIGQLTSLKIIKYSGLIYILILIFIDLLNNNVLSIKLNIYTHAAYMLQPEMYITNFKLANVS